MFRTISISSIFLLLLILSTGQVAIMPGAVSAGRAIVPNDPCRKDTVKIAVMAGQSNGAFQNPANIADLISTEKSWDPNDILVKYHFGYQQTLNSRYSPLIPTSEKMRVRFPNDSLYFMVWHKSGTDLATQWHPSTANGLFRNLLEQMEMMLSHTDRRPYKMYFIWVQGEQDGANLTKANAYGANEKLLFDSLSTRFNIAQFLNYIPRGGTYTYIIQQQKEAHALLNSKISLIYLPNINNQANNDAMDLLYFSDSQHMNLTGIDYFSTAVTDSIQ
jgi:hypothetical protein